MWDVSGVAAKRMRTVHDFHLFKSFRRQRTSLHYACNMISGDSRSSRHRSNAAKDGKMVKMKSTTIFPQKFTQYLLVRGTN